MSHAYTENQLVEQPAVQLFAELGWETACAVEEVFGPGATFGRESKGDAMLSPRLRLALEKLNPALPPEAITVAVDELARDRSAMSLVAANREVYALLKDGVKVSVPDRERGGQKIARVRVVDWEKMLCDRPDVIVMNDEAHRSQYDTLAVNMRSALPNALFLAFTGTPLIAGEERTREVFGDYVSIYDFQQSVEDGATVPLFYENRTPELHLKNPNLNDDIRADRGCGAKRGSRAEAGKRVGQAIPSHHARRPPGDGGEGSCGTF